MHQHDNDKKGALQNALGNFELARKAYDAKIPTLKHESIQDLERYLSDKSRRDIEIQRAAAECMTLIGGQDLLDSHFLTTALTLRFALRGFDLARLAQHAREGAESVDATSAQAAMEIAVNGLDVLSHMYNFRVIVLENFCGKLSSSTMRAIFMALGVELRNRGLEEVIKALVASAIPALGPLIEALKVVDAARTRVVEQLENYRGRGAEDDLFAFRRVLRAQKQTFESLFQSVSEGASVLVAMAEATLGQPRH